MSLEQVFFNFVAGLREATKGYESGKLNSECAAVAVADDSLRKGP